MPTMRVTTPAAQLTAGAQISVLSNTQFEFLPFNALVEFAIIGNSGEAATVNLVATVYSGQDILQEQGPITLKSPTTPIYPDDFLLNDTSLQGERLKVLLANLGTTTAANPVNTVVRITPV
jgi:hypothetical protein